MFVSEVPARICFFGEHQDYLGLPVIACAIPLCCRIEVRVANRSSSRRLLVLRVPQLDQTTTYDLDSLPPQQSPRALNNDPDFALAAIHEAIVDGWELTGAECTSTTEFPMQAGISSSSAFCVAWFHVLAKLAGKTPISPIELARLAHRAEVAHFDAPGGTMDHVTCAVGGMLRIGPGKWDVTLLNSNKNTESRGVWILAYSGEPKDTLKHLHRCKNARLSLYEKLGENWDCDDEGILSSLTVDEKQLLETTLINRNTERQAAQHWNSAAGETIAEWMQHHHNALRDGLHLSSIRLEALNEAAQSAGAWGFKVVGSGGGGCGVAWTSPSLAQTVAAAMERAGAPNTWIIQEPARGAQLKP
uniref:Galactokinase n=1 Tax=Entomoneis paludosa TaxID=265537 RepID=A0A7S2Y3X7_9STRA